jgi:uncharacterized protein (TIGR02466 family)
MINFKMIPIFPEAFIYVGIVEIDSNKIIEYAKNIDFELTTDSKKNNYNCYISKNMNVFNDLEFLKDEINKHVKHYLYDLFKYKMDHKFINSWFTKTSINGFSQKHIHRNSFLSGVYYPIGNSNFKIKFHKDKKSFWNIEKEEVNEYSFQELIFSIEQNSTLILFPSDLKHNIVYNNLNIDRYSLAFNINPKGYIGDADTKVFF